MNERTKESVFLDAINKYAEKQKATISTEVEEYKNKRIEQATEEGLKDAYEMIQRDIAKQKAQIVIEYSAKEQALRAQQFEQRRVICDRIFRAARKRLTEYTSSSAYEQTLKKSAACFAELFQSETIVVSLSEKDMRFTEMLKSILPNAQFKEDDGIEIGGMKAFCKETAIIADDTLDSKLKDQREWFIENAGLKVV